MKKLREGRRYLSVVGALAGVAVVCLCLGSLLLTLDYRGQVQTANRTAAATAAALRASIQANYQVCVVRNASTLLVDGLEQADADLQRSMIKVERSNHFVDAALRAKRIAAYTKKLVADERYLTFQRVDCKSIRDAAVASSTKGG